MSNPLDDSPARVDSQHGRDDAKWDAVAAQLQEVNTAMFLSCHSTAQKLELTNTLITEQHILASHREPNGTSNTGFRALPKDGMGWPAPWLFGRNIVADSQM